MYDIKTKEEFELEFDFSKGEFLGEGSFGIVKKWSSSIKIGGH